MVQWYSTGYTSLNPHLINVSLDQPKSTIQMAIRSVHPFLHSSRQSVIRHTRARPSAKKWAINIGRPGRPCPSSTWYLLGSIRVHISNDISIGSAAFAQLTAERPYTLQQATFPPSKWPLPMGDQDPNLIQFLGPIRAHNRNGILIS